ncbi:Lissencephaly-1 [Coemansia sp. RSA 988]|nr:Lissencephaly-1 [Coemansia sp. RSA 988]
MSVEHILPERQLKELQKAMLDFMQTQGYTESAEVFARETDNEATASEDMSVKIWDSESADFERTLKGHTKSIQDMVFDQKGKILVTCSADLTLRVWDVSDDYKCVRTLYGHDHCVSAVAFLGSDKLVSASRDKSVKIWELSTGYCIKTITGHADWVRAVAVSDDARMICTASNDQSVRLWDPATGECKGDMRGHENVVEVAKFAPVCAHPFLRRLVGLPPLPLKSNGTSTADTSQSSESACQFIISGSRDKTLRLWDATSSQMLHVFTGHDDWVRDFVFHPSGKQIISVSDDKTMRIWDLASGRCAKSIQASDHFTTCIDYSSVNPQVATGSVDTETKKLLTNMDEEQYKGTIMSEWVSMLDLDISEEMTEEAVDTIMQEHGTELEPSEFMDKFVVLASDLQRTAECGHKCRFTITDICEGFIESRADFTLDSVIDMYMSSSNGKIAKYCGKVSVNGEEYIEFDGETTLSELGLQENGEEVLEFNAHFIDEN